jgi:C-terminal processing protease CtpA/Prc
MAGNVLRNYRVTIDYKSHVSYWLKVSEPDRTDLNSVGISLVHTTKNYIVGGLARVHGAVSVAGVAVGDRLTEVDGKDITGATRGEVISALHGAPGDHRRLTLERKGQTIQADTLVTGY